tara:strand:+ start:707 stop:970 length:264 start_codon:yes stop_codon:yes gene_type:complete
MTNPWDDHMPMLKDTKNIYSAVSKELDNNGTFKDLKKSINKENLSELVWVFRDVFLAGYINGWDDSDNFNMLLDERRIARSREEHNG